MVDVAGAGISQREVQDVTKDLVDSRTQLWLDQSGKYHLTSMHMGSRELTGTWVAGKDGKVFFLPNLSGPMGISSQPTDCESKSGDVIACTIRGKSSDGKDGTVTFTFEKQ